MATMARDTWTDKRLDDLKASVDAGFQGNREEFRAVRREIHESSEAVRTEMRTEFKAVRGEIAGVRGEVGSARGEIAGVRGEVAGVRGEMREIRSELGALNRTIHQFTFALVGTVFLGFMGTIAALFSLTQ